MKYEERNIASLVLYGVSTADIEKGSYVVMSHVSISSFSRCIPRKTPDKAPESKTC